MKRETLLMTVLVVMAMLFASCSNSLGEKTDEGGTSTQTVSVSLGVEIEGGAQKTIGTDTDLDGLTYWYKANHNWTQDRPVHGDTGANFILIPNYSVGAAPKNLGNFTAGEWTFYVEVRKGDAVIYSGNTDYTIYTGHASPEVTVTPDGTGTGTVDITVKVPTTGASEVLSVSYTGGSPANMTRSGTASSLTTFTKTISSLAPGAYTFTFQYTDQSGAVTEGASQAVTVFAGQTSSITGTIDGGKWHSSQITINAPEITGFTLTAAGSATSVAPSTNLVYTADATSALGNTITYQWFVNGVSQGAASTTPTFTFNNANYGMYDVTCSAIDATAKIIKSLSLYVQVGYKVTFAAGTNGTVAYGTNSSATSIFAENDIVSMSVTPAANYHVGTLSPAGEYDDATHTATFYMPDEDTEFAVTFVAD